MTMPTVHTPAVPTPDALTEGITIMLDDLGVTIDELDARNGRFRSDVERRAWFVANELRHNDLHAGGVRTGRALIC